MTALVFGLFLFTGGMAVGATAPFRPHQRVARHIVSLGLVLLAAGAIYLSSIGSL